VIGEPRLHVGACESTQLLLLDSGLPEGAVATADHQTAGRGRLGAAWIEAPGTSVLCSVLLRPPPDRPARQLSLLAGLAVAETVEWTTDLSVQIKWPNDVMLRRQKVAGVLAEQRRDDVVVGIGINVNQTAAELPTDTRHPAGSLLTLTGRSYDREEVTGSLLERLEYWYEQWKAGGLDALYGELGARDFLRGRRVTVDSVSGVASGIDREGRLVVDGQAVDSGEVSFQT
jgi:BirA family biotin operon repressor/biotin-[acetyl-CoA-carboxylase] ligase